MDQRQEKNQKLVKYQVEKNILIEGCICDVPECKDRCGKAHICVDSSHSSR